MKKIFVVGILMLFIASLFIAGCSPGTGERAGNADAVLSCEDSDTGRAYTTPGVVEKNGLYFNDRCEPDGMLNETYCEGLIAKSEKVSCPVVTGNPDSYCEAGACTLPVAEDSCIDSDTGMNYRERGEVTEVKDGVTSMFNDFCIDRDTLKEYRCGSEGMLQEEVRCADVTDNPEAYCIVGTGECFVPEAISVTDSYEGKPGTNPCDTLDCGAAGCNWATGACNPASDGDAANPCDTLDCGDMGCNREMGRCMTAEDLDGTTYTVDDETGPCAGMYCGDMGCNTEVDPPRCYTVGELETAGEDDLGDDPCAGMGCPWGCDTSIPGSPVCAEDPALAESGVTGEDDLGDDPCAGMGCPWGCDTSVPGEEVCAGDPSAI